MSSAVDDDVAGTVAEGRQHLGTMLSTAQTHLQKVFILFVIGLVGTIYVLRAFVWARLKADLNANDSIDIVAITPFEVILLQVKIGLVVGVVLTIPPLVYYSRDALRRRGRWPEHLPRWKAAGFVIVSALLFAGGVAYAYLLFFPLMLDFLASNAVGAGFNPNYSISMWAQFVFLLSLSFGLAAQLPLAMSSLAYSGIVRYETFRNRWKYAVVAIFVFGALFSPPDPFTQVMWAVPLVTLYAISLYLTKVIVTTKRSSDDIDVTATAREDWNLLAGLFVAGGALIYGFYTAGVYGFVNRGLAAAGSSYRFLGEGAAAGNYAITETAYLVLFGLLYGVLFVVVGLAYLVYEGLDSLGPDEFAVPGGSQGDPADIDLSELDEEGIWAAPAVAFAQLEEEEALALASEAVDEDNPGQARAILDRFDNVNADDAEVSPSDFEDDESTESTDAAADEADADADAGDEEEAGILARRGAGMLDAFSEDDIDEDDVGGYAYDIAFILDSLTSKSFRLVGVDVVEAVEDGPGLPGVVLVHRLDNVNADDAEVSPSDFEDDESTESTDAAADEAGADADAGDEEEAGILARRGAGMLDAFSEDDIDEDDVGGYAYDIAFILDSLTSKSFRLVGLFMTVMAATFVALYRGGIGILQEQFTSRMSAEAAAQVDIVTLHPVEALIFMIKVSVIFGVAATLPLLLYYAWPALKDRGLARGDRRVLLVWGGTLVAGLVVGSLLGFLYVAPAVISWLAADVLEAGMLIRYRINNYGWLIVFLTVGIGILAVIPVSMLLFHQGNLATYGLMRGRWREVTLGILGAAAFLSPRGVFTMFLLGIPVVAAYVFGLGLLWLLTLGGRRTPGPAEPAD